MRNVCFCNTTTCFIIVIFLFTKQSRLSGKTFILTRNFSPFGVKMLAPRNIAALESTSVPGSTLQWKTVVITKTYYPWPASHNFTVYLLVIHKFTYFGIQHFFCEDTLGECVLQKCKNIDIACFNLTFWAFTKYMWYTLTQKM